MDSDEGCRGSSGRPKIGESIAASTVWEYELCGRLIERYIKHRYSRNDMSIKEVKIGFISGFHAWLLKERKMKQNSATKHLKFLQKIMNIAVMNGYIPYITLIYTKNHTLFFFKTPLNLPNSSIDFV